LYRVKAEVPPFAGSASNTCDMELALKGATLKRAWSDTPRRGQEHALADSDIRDSRYANDRKVS
jgi:hypothetical protein